MPANPRPELFPGLPVTEGMLVPVERALPPLPLEHTHVRASVIGPICAVRMVQRFFNRHERPVEAIYAFPLPVDAAVSELTLTIGERVVRGEVREREQARRAYAEARDRRQGAALLEQVRPNLFTVAVANIQPGERVEVTLGFHDRVPYDDGAFTFTFPTVVLPRYVPPAGLPAAEAALTPPLLPEDSRDGHTISMQVDLDVGRVAAIDSPSHTIDVAQGRSLTTVSLRQADALPNRDFVLRYRLAGVRALASCFTYRAAGQPGTLLLLLTPQADPRPDDIHPRELLFVFDRSGSMMGDSIVQARNALKACLRALNDGDTFNIFPFDHEVEQFSPEPLPFTQASVDQADAYIERIEARGGTEILGALRQALAQPRDPGRLRMLVFLTDGAVGNEDQVLRELRAALNEARVFAFGIGSAVNRFLLDQLAEVGRGSVEYIFPGQAIEDAVQRFQNRAAFPLLADLSLDWGGAQVADVYPSPLPDLYAGQPLTLLARFHGSRAQAGALRLRGRTPRGPYEETLDFELPADPRTGEPCDRPAQWAALPRVWARARIDALMTRERDDPRRKSAVRDEIIGLALEYGLLSPYTSFVAVEERRREHEGRDAAETVLVPIHLPQGTHREAFEAPGGGPPRGMALRMAAAPSSAPRVAKSGGGGFLARLGGGLQGAADGGGAEAESADMFMSIAALAAASPSPAREEAALTLARRYEAALRYLARSQGVSGAWADSPTATALVVLAFLAGGHSDRAGGYRPQLTRAVRWLAAHAGQGGAAPAAALALAALAALTGHEAHAAARNAALAGASPADDLDTACLTAARRLAAEDRRPETGDWRLALPELPIAHLQSLIANLSEREALALALSSDPAAGAALAALQQWEGGDDGAVVPPGRRAGSADAVVIAATAAGALVWSR